MMNRIQYTTGKAPPQYICGVLTATTGQPCKRGVSFEGDRCMYHKGHQRDPISVEAALDIERTSPVQVKKCIYMKSKFNYLLIPCLM
jgi:hypothetical protein